MKNAVKVPRPRKVEVIGWNGTFLATGFMEVIKDGEKIKLVDVRFHNPLPSGRFARFKIDERDLKYLDDKRSW